MKSAKLSFDCADPVAFARALQHHKWMTRQAGQVELWNSDEVPFPSDFGTLPPSGVGFQQQSISRIFDTSISRQSYTVDQFIHKVVLTDTPVMPATVRDYFNDIKALPFEVASYDKMYPGFKTPHCIGAFHYGVGPAVAFRGAGHQRLCSPRLLEMGPWYVHRDEATDTTVIQFHSDDVDDASALKQAERGHYLVHFYDDIGARYVVNSEFCTFEAFELTYIPERRVYRIHQPKGQRASSTRMADANALRFHSRIDPKRFAAIEQQRGETSYLKEDRTSAWPRRTPLLKEPFDDIEFYYDDPVDAYQDLMELWVRGLPCVARFPDGDRPVGVDFKAPKPVLPDWVLALKAKYG